MLSENEQDILVLRQFIARWTREEAIAKKRRGEQQKYVGDSKWGRWVKQLLTMYINCILYRI